MLLYDKNVSSLIVRICVKGGDSVIKISCKIIASIKTDISWCNKIGVYYTKRYEKFMQDNQIAVNEFRSKAPANKYWCV